MIVAFQLTMPGRQPSWNGKWSGEGRIYCLTKTYSGKKQEEKAKKIASEEYWYRWDDGWQAKITASIVSSAESAKLRKQSVGFAGYNWMVETICLYGRIMDDHQVSEHYRLQREAMATK